VRRVYKKRGRKEKSIQDFGGESLQSKNIKIKICTSTSLSLSYMGVLLGLSS
jgi:hypothetical protein